MDPFPLSLVRLEESREPQKSPFSTPVEPRKPAQAQVPTPAELDALPIGVGAIYKGPSHKPISPGTRLDKPRSGAEEVADGIAKPSDVHSRGSSSTWNEMDHRVPVEPPTPSQLEMSRPSSPLQTVEAVQSWRDPAVNTWRVMSACIFLFANGMNDSAPGALLPYIESHYNVGYAIVSLIFIANAIGFILAAFFIHALDNKVGRARTIMLADGLCLAAYLILAFAPPFPFFVIAFFMSGVGIATPLALHNVFVANLANATVLLGTVQGAYGVGGIIAPIVATSLITRGVLFSRFYFILLGVRLLSFCAGGFAFWNFEKDAKSLRLNDVHLSSRTGLNSTADRSPSAQSESDFHTSSKTSLVKALKNRTTLVGALFIFAYQGAEVSVSGWVISFLISYRDSSPAKVGYVTSGFWGGITLGRFVLSHFAPRIGEKTFAYGLILGAICFQLLVWLVPNVIGSSVFVALLGFLLGPVYPCGATIFTRLLPKSVQNTALAFISSAGSSGGAIAPFLTGILAQASGTWVLHPICVSLYALMISCWAGLPIVAKRRE